MSKVKFKLNEAGVGKLLKSPEAQALVMDYASRIRNKCGDGYETSVIIGKYRARASVIAATYEARRDNLENNTLLKARGGGR